MRRLTMPGRRALSRAPSRYAAPALVLSGAALFGTIGTAQALGPDVPIPQLAAARLLVAALLLVLVAAASGFSSALRGSLREAPTWWAGLSQVSFNLCFFAAMTQAGVAVGTLVAIGATPILTGLVTRQVNRRWVLATGVALTGLLLLVGGQVGTDSAPSWIGILLAVGASASYATYIIAGDAAAARRMETQPYLAAAFSISALLTCALLFTGDISWAASVAGTAMVAYLAVFTTVLAYSLFNRGLRGVRAGTASTLGLIEPVVASLLAFAVLHERLSPQGVTGAVLILVGLVLIVRSTGRSATDSAEVAPLVDNARRA